MTFRLLFLCSFRTEMQIEEIIRLEMLTKHTKMSIICLLVIAHVYIYIYIIVFVENIKHNSHLKIYVLLFILFCHETDTRDKVQQIRARVIPNLLNK